MTGVTKRDRIWEGIVRALLTSVPFDTVVIGFDWYHYNSWE
jgi:hypothetical protein